MKRLLVLCAGVTALLAATAAFANAAQPARWQLTLSVDRAATAVPGVYGVMFSGTLTSLTAAGQVMHRPVAIVMFAGSSCAIGESSSLDFGETPPLTGVHGAFTHASPHAIDLTKTWSFRAEVQIGEETVVSNCVTIGPGVSAVAAPPESNVFLCYSAFQTNPGVWPTSQAPALMKAGYWSPYAVKGNAEGGTNLGGYNLACNLATAQAAGSQFATSDGSTSGPDAYSTVNGVPGWYPVIP